MENYKIGIDVGNSDTKTMHTTTQSSYESYSKLPAMAKEYILYNGRYYIPCEERTYVLDKTNSEFSLILTFFAIAKEILYQIGNVPKEKAQQKIGTISVIDIGIGLPPGYLGLKDKTLKYYHNNLSKPVSFEYNGFKFCFKLGACNIFPQGYAAVALNKKVTIPMKYNSYYIIDIGGITIDVVPIMNKEPIVKKCVSIEMGILNMFDGIMDKMACEDQITLNYNVIQNVLTNESTALDKEIESKIIDYAEEWTERIINTLRQRGVEYKAYPCIFMGGGSKLLRKYITKNPLVLNTEFILNPKANAIGYYQYLRIMN